LGEENGSGDGRAVAYLRTSSATNVGGDSGDRQREAIRLYASRAGLEVVETFYDAAVSGADPLDQREGFTQLLAYAKEHGVGVVLVETASRFARSLMVQELGLQVLRREGIRLVAVDSPETFAATDDPMVEAVRQMLGVMAQLEKAMTVAKLRGARDRKSAELGRRIEGQKGYAETNPELVAQARRLARRNPRTGTARSLREIAGELAALGFATAAGKPFSASQVQRLLERG
jgi:DNA invertase Pin-like site-specific DNA recombinase